VGIGDKGIRFFKAYPMNYEEKGDPPPGEPKDVQGEWGKGGLSGFNNKIWGSVNFEKEGKLKTGLIVGGTHTGLKRGRGLGVASLGGLP